MGALVMSVLAHAHLWWIDTGGYSMGGIAEDAVEFLPSGGTIAALLVFAFIIAKTPRLGTVLCWASAAWVLFTALIYTAGWAMSGILGAGLVFVPTLLLVVGAALSRHRSAPA